MARHKYRRAVAALGLGLWGCGMFADPGATQETASEIELAELSSALSIEDVAVEAEMLADGCPSCAIEVTPATGLRRVLLLSIDGMHAIDFYKWVANNPPSNIGMLYVHGIDYPNAMASTPSGGFPGMLALTTGGSPKTTGVYDEDSYDRTLFPPGSDCLGTAGTEVIYDHTIVEDASSLRSPIDEANLPRRMNSLNECVPVYPHEFLAAPTLFEVVQSTGRRTSWADNHAGYEMLSGPSGLGLSEFFSPSVNSPVANGGSLNGVNLAASLASCNSTNSVSGPNGIEFATCVPAAQAYDDAKVQSVINKIEGFSADGSRLSAVPTVLGMNFTALQVAQRLPVASAGYLNAGGDPGVLVDAALQHIDTSIGQILAALQTEHLIEKTLIVLTAKHGQAPIDRSKVRTEYDIVNPIDNPRTFVQLVDPDVDTLSASFVNPNDFRSPATGGHVQTRDGALVWLQNQNNVNVSDVVQMLSDPLFRSAMGASVRPSGSIFSSNIVSGSELSLAFGDPQSSDPLASARAPNVFVQPELGVLYTTLPGEPAKIADSGGGAQDDINVPLLISNSAIVQHVSIYQPVSTKQVAPTILTALRLDVTELTAAVNEGTNPLPGIVWGPGDYRGGSTINAVDYDSQTSTQLEGTPPYVSYFDSGSSFCFNNVFLTDVTAIKVTLASNNSGGVFSLRTGSPTGSQIGSFTVQSTGSWTTWTTVTVSITPTTGLHTLCFRGDSGTGIANFTAIELVVACVPECTGATCGSDGCGGTCGTCGFNFLCDDPFGQCVIPPTKYSVVNTTFSDTIPAPDYDVQSGTQLGGGGTSLGSLDANDYACYYGVDLTSVQKLVVTLASATSGGVFSLRVGSPTGTLIGSYTVSSTGGATTWKPKQVALSASTSGSHALCVRGETGSGIANFQSFQLSDQPVQAKWEVNDVIPAAPPDGQQGTTNNVAGYVENFDAADYVCYDDVDLSSVNSIVASVASDNGGGVFAARLGGPTGTQVATFGVPDTGGWTNWQDLTAGITPVSGLNTLCFVGVSGSGIANLESFTLSPTVVPADYVVGNAIPAVPPDSQLGTTTDPGNYISYYDSGDYVCYDNVDMTGVNSIVANVASSNSGGTISVRLGSSSGSQVGAFTVFSTGGWTNWVNVSVPVTPSSGITTLCFVGTSGSGIANLNTFTLSASSVTVNYSSGGTIPATPVTSQQGIQTTGNIISYFDSGDWFCYAGINLTGVQTIRASAASGNTNGQLAVRLGSASGYQIGTRSNLNTGGFSTWANRDITISNVPGVHTLCFTGTASTGIANFQSFSLLP